MSHHRRIGLLLYPDCLPAGLFGFSDLLLAAGLRTGQQRFAFTWLSADGRPVECTNGVTLPAMPLQKAQVDAILVPGAWRDQSTVMAASDTELVDQLADFDDNTAIWSYCTGVCLAARAGRLDAHTATTTWWLRDLVVERFEQVHWRLDRTVVWNPDRATASGVNGFLPLALELIAAEWGRDIVEVIRRQLVLPQPRFRHTPFEPLRELIHASEWLRRLFVTVERIPAMMLTAEEVADRLGMSTRTLQRRVKQQCGYPCGELLRLIKLDQVSGQLLGSDHSVQVIAEALGYSDDTVLRRSFKQVTGMTPGQYRSTFAGDR